MKCQTYINYVLGKYEGVFVHYWPSGAMQTDVGILYLKTNTSHSNCVKEVDSCQVGVGSEPWDILVNIDSSMICYLSWGTDSSIVFGKLYSNDSIHLKMRMTQASDGVYGGFKYFNGHKLYSAASGIEQLTSDKTQLSICPNPAADVMYIQNTETGIKNKPILYDINGGQLEVEMNYINTTAYKANVSALPNGMYFIRFQTGSGLVNKKVIVQH